MLNLFYHYGRLLVQNGRNGNSEIRATESQIKNYYYIVKN